MGTEIKILKTKDIVELYGIPLGTVYELLNIRGCPVIKGGANGKHYLVEQSAFERWLKERTAKG